MDETFTISIPTDEDGFATMQCPYCGEFFKVKAEDYSAEDVIDLWCPSCGLTADSFVPDEVIELAQSMVINKFQEELCSKLSRIGLSSLTNNTLSFSVSCSIEKERERNLIPAVDAYELVFCKRCCRTTKVKPIVDYTGAFCSFCGERL